MISVEHWAEIRRLHKVEKLSKRAIARRLGIHRNTVTNALADDEPPKYERESRGSILDPYKPKIHALLESNPSADTGDGATGQGRDSPARCVCQLHCPEKR